MTEQDLVSWALDCYFASWEIEQAEAILESEGMDAAVEHLRNQAISSQRGYGGPDMPSYDTRNGRIEIRDATTGIGAEPDLTYDIKWFARRKLESLYQPKLL
uniref:Uncharacterized protein n=2 Tax=viral metagenome TaxID=1070528 RepID=A0A6M3KKP7_9ZZZZ